jgi:hypothetical protein
MWLSLRTKINAPVFLLALVLSFAGCCYAGHQCALRHPFKNFRHFYPALSSETYFYPTISQMVSLAKESLDQGKTVIIVGGNSVAEGRGQGKDLWTDNLQNKVGSNYKILNFAQAGMPAFSGPYIAFLSLSATYKKVVYIAVTEGLYVNLPDNPFNGYPYWLDAQYKHLLPDFPQLEENMEAPRQDFSSSVKQVREEHQIRSFLDSIFYFQDLWTSIGYNSIFTVWTKDTAATFWRPRKDYPDHDFSPIPIENRFVHLKLEFEKDRMTNLFKYFFDRDKLTYKWQTSQENLHAIEKLMRVVVPEQLRSRVLIATVRNCPYIVKRALNENEQDFVTKQCELNYTLWTKVGCRALDAGSDYEDKDYLDGCHLSGSGGDKLANSIATEIPGLLKESSHE